jgi:hypothetical protein
MGHSTWPTWHARKKPGLNRPNQCNGWVLTVIFDPKPDPTQTRPDTSNRETRVNPARLNSRHESDMCHDKWPMIWPWPDSNPTRCLNRSSLATTKTHIRFLIHRENIDNIRQREKKNFMQGCNMGLGASLVCGQRLDTTRQREKKNIMQSHNTRLRASLVYGPEMLTGLGMHPRRRICCLAGTPRPGRQTNKRCVWLLPKVKSPKRLPVNFGTFYRFRCVVDSKPCSKFR